MNVTLSPETWNLVLAMAAEKPIPRYLAIPALLDFERALQAAEQAAKQPVEPPAEEAA